MEEWPGNSSFEHQYCSSFEQSLYNLLSPQYDQINAAAHHQPWTFEETKLFENALAAAENPISPAFFENVASRVLPWKSMEDIHGHYQALIRDVEMIESGQIPIPDYKTDDLDHGDGETNKEMVLENTCQKNHDQQGSSSPLTGGKKNKGTNQQRRKGVPWTEQEHQLFLMGLNKYGKGDWRSISRYYVVTKTPTQVASHAQKYFRRQTSTTPADRRRPSIHDIQTLMNPITFSTGNNYDGNISLTNAVDNVQDQALMFGGSYNISDVGDHNDNSVLNGLIFNGGVDQQQMSSFDPMGSQSNLWW